MSLLNNRADTEKAFKALIRSTGRALTRPCPYHPSLPNDPPLCPLCNGTLEIRPNITDAAFLGNLLIVWNMWMKTAFDSGNRESFINMWSVLSEWMPVEQVQSLSVKEKDVEVFVDFFKELNREPEENVVAQAMTEEDLRELGIVE